MASKNFEQTSRKIKPISFRSMVSSTSTSDDRTSTTGSQALDHLDFSSFRVASRDLGFETLRKVYQDVQGETRDSSQEENTSNMILVSGIGGTGKSTLVKQFVDEVIQKSRLGKVSEPHFLTGKYNKTSGSDPYSAIIAAFGDFAQDLMPSHPNEKATTAESKVSGELERLRGLITKALGDDANQLVKLIPQLKNILGASTKAVESLGVEDENNADALNRLKYIFQAFVNAVSTKERPLVLFLDDLQWIDDASLKLIYSLAVDPDLSHFMLIGAYRSDEVSPGGELWRTFEAIQMVQEYETIGLSNLSKSELEYFVTRVLHLQKQRKKMSDQSRVLIDDLADALYKKTDGNLFFATQTMKELEDKEVLTYSFITSQWELDWNHVDKAEFVKDDVMSMVTGQIVRSSDVLQSILKTMAFSKSPIDIAMLRELLDGDGIKTSFHELVEELDLGTSHGLLSHKIGSPDYAFAHDKIQQAAYSLVPAGEVRRQYMSSIGTRLLKMSSRGGAEDWTLFVATDHLNESASQSDFLFHLNLKAAKKAASVAAYDTASKFLRLSLDHIVTSESDPWQSKYDLALKTNERLADVLFNQGNYEEGKDVAQTLLDNAKTIDDKLPTLLSLSVALGKERKQVKSLELCLSTLRKLKEFPKGKAGVISGLVVDMMVIKRFFKTHTDEEILKLPFMTSERKKRVMQLMTSASYQATYAGDFLSNVSVNLKMLKIMFKHGLSQSCVQAILLFGMIADGMNDVGLRRRLVELSRKVMKRTKAKAEECRLICGHTTCFDAWNEPVDKVLALLDQSHKAGMKAGRYEDAFLSSLNCAGWKYISGFPLSAVILEYESLLQKVRLHSLDILDPLVGAPLSLYYVLVGKTELDFASSGAFALTTYDPEKLFERLMSCLSGMQLGVFFGDLKFCEKMMATFGQLPDTGTNTYVKSQFNFFGAMSNSLLYHKTQKKSYLRKAQQRYKELTAMASLRGDNCLHRCKIMKAHIDVASHKGKKGHPDAQILFDETIDYASKTGFKHDAGVGAQMAAEYFLSKSTQCKKTEAASVSLSLAYFERARGFYNNWGADALVSHIEDCIQGLPTSARMAGSFENNHESHQPSRLLQN